MDEHEATLREHLMCVNAAKRARIRQLWQEINENHDRQMRHEIHWLRSHTIYPAGSFESYRIERHKKRDEIDFLADDIAGLRVEDGILMRVQVTDEARKAVEREALEEGR